ncbi:MAG: DUF5723 family protein [Bacteroidales bacterium]|jgi:predicted outer membrane repeat protein|nr:DUF5723 family protein [Bacteroidales bacterium]
MKKIIITLLIIIVSVQIIKAQGQTGTAQYFLKILPQQSNNNPAFIPNVRSYTSFPLLGNIHLEVNNELFSWNRLIERGADDSLRININKFLSKLENKNLLRLSFDEEIIRFGFHGAGGFFHAGIAAHGEANIVLSKNTLDFALRGMGANINESNLNGNSLSAMAYAYFYLGYARQIGKKLTVGGRVKLINGIADISTKKLDARWSILNEDMSDPDITPYSYELELNSVIRSTLPLPLGGDNFSFDFANVLGNMGFGIDLGINYAVTPDFNVSASVLDMGAIFWNKGTEYVSDKTTSAPFIFQGMGNLNLSKGFEFDSILSPMIQEIIDTLGFQKTDRKKYTTALPTQFLVGASYTVAEMNTFGLLLKGQILGNKFFNVEVGVSYTFMIKNFGISINNTFTRNSAFNFGGAIVANAGPIQFHLGIDRITSFNVAAMRGVNFNFGINILIGKKEILRHKIQAVEDEEAAEQNMQLQK